MKSLTIIFTSCREKHKFKWAFDCIVNQSSIGDDIDFRQVLSRFSFLNPKPTVWQGKHRLTKEDWWAAANARNTGLCHAKGEWVAFLDDRCVLMPGWLDCIREAMEGEYAVFGSYEKRTHMKVVDGVITEPGNIIGTDTREAHTNQYLEGRAPVFCGGEWCFGCNLALPLEWALQVNGWDETCDGLGMEDCIFGLQLQNNGFKLRYDKRMKIVEDRTPDELDSTMRREDFGVSPNDYSHKLLGELQGNKRAAHPYDLRGLRQKTLSGEPWPQPWGPKVHPWNNKPLGEL